MPIGEIWTQSQRMAWQYVRDSWLQGLSATEALEAYRAGGGEIRTSWWYELYHRAESAAETWEKVAYLKPEDTVPESYFEPVDINFSKRYVINFSIRGVTETGEVVTEMYRYAQSNKRLTWGEWLNTINEAITKDPTKPGIVKYELRDLAFYTKSA